MNLESAIAAVERFFLDIIGAVIPGLVVCFGSARVLGTEWTIGTLSVTPGSPGFSWPVAIGVAYILGHAVDQVAEHLVMPRFLGRNRLLAAIADTFNYQAFRQYELQRLPPTSVGSQATRAAAREVRELRNRALTLASEEDKSRIFRFMFLSLFMGGTVSAIAYLLLLWILVRLAPGPWPEVLGAVIVTALLMWRSWDFYERAQRVPFSMARVGRTREARMGGGTVQTSRRGRVYLAGGFKTGWQDTVVASNPELTFIDPRSHALPASHEYTAWDLAGIRSADVVFAYLEASNPAGYSLALEVGYARAHNKLVILVNEKKTMGEIDESRYYGMLGEAADLEFPSLEAGVGYLTTLPL